MASEASGTRSQLRWEQHRRTFEEYLRELRFTDESRLRGLEGAMRYSMLAGGKRVRPTLCMEVAWVFGAEPAHVDRKSTRLNSSHANISYAVFCLKKKKQPQRHNRRRS